MSNKKDSAHSVIINIPRPRKFPQKQVHGLETKHTKKRLFENAARNPSDANLKKYSLPESKPLKYNVLKRDDSLLPFKLYAKKQDNIKREQRMKIKLHERYKIISTNLRKRLHIEDPLDNVRAVSDIDDSYFTYMNECTTAQYIPLYKSLKFQFHQRLRARQEIGYRDDCVLSIEKNHKKVLEVYNDSLNECMKQAKQFDAFISEDYKQSMERLQKCEALLSKVNEKMSLREQLANEQFTIQSALIGIDYLYFIQQKYGRFLYYLSPPSWRAKHREFAHSVEIEAKGFDLGYSSEEDTFNVIFEKMQNECFGTLVQPVLYFTHPDVLVALLNNAEEHTLHHFSHLARLAPRAKMLKKMSKKLKHIIEQDSALVAHIIDEFKELVNFCEQREEQLQAKFLKILYGLFYDSVAATDVLKLQMYLEYCYEKLFAEKSSITSLKSTAKALENLYMEYSLKLETITNSKMKTAMKQCVEDENKKTKKAHLAARELRLFVRLEHALLRAYDQVNVDRKPSMKVAKRSSTRLPKRSVTKCSARTSSQRELTDAEIEYLYMFTDWTENENPAKYLLSLNDRKSSIQ